MKQCSIYYSRVKFQSFLGNDRNDILHVSNMLFKSLASEKWIFFWGDFAECGILPFVWLDVKCHSMIASKKYWMSNPLLLVQYDPKLPDDSGEVPKPNGVVGGWNPGYEIICLLDRKTSQVVKCLPCSNSFFKSFIIIIYRFGHLWIKSHAWCIYIVCHITYKCIPSWKHHMTLMCNEVITYRPLINLKLTKCSGSVFVSINFTWRH